MKIAVHITFFFVESRLKYLQQVIDNFEKFPHEVKIFVYTNQVMESAVKAKSIQFKIFPYRKSGVFGYNKGIWNKLGLTSLVHPYHLSWENRKIVEQTVDDFDVQIYLEDDIDFTIGNFNYWMKYKDICLQNKYNLGFLRIEFNESNQAYLTDLLKWPEKKMELSGHQFMINDESPYCGFWIYDKKELKEFIKTKEWEFNFKGLGIREKSSIGWHGLMMNHYKATILPLLKSANGDELLSQACVVHHIPNSYIHDAVHCKLKLPDLVKED